MVESRYPPGGKAIAGQIVYERDMALMKNQEEKH
jgi:hypothetical protein